MCFILALKHSWSVIDNETELLLKKAMVEIRDSFPKSHRYLISQRICLIQANSFAVVEKGTYSASLDDKVTFN